MAKKRKEKRKLVKLNQMEQGVVKHLRELVETNKYDAVQDWGAISLTLISLRPHTVDGELTFIRRGGTHVGSEIPDSQPTMQLLMKYEMAKAMERQGREVREWAEQQGADALVMKAMDVPVGLSDEGMDDIVRGEMAKSKGAVH